MTSRLGAVFTRVAGIIGILMGLIIIWKRWLAG
jgi:hypothetical protein